MRAVVTAALLAVCAANAALPPRIELNLPEQLGARLVQTTEDINGIPCDSWGADKRSCADMSRVHHKTYYAMCEVGKDDATSCPEPEASGYDHHEGVIPVTKRVLLFVDGPKHGLPRFRRKILPKLDYNIRGEYTLVYDAHDSSGNKAQTLLFHMFFVDHTPPRMHPNGLWANTDVFNPSTHRFYQLYPPHSHPGTHARSHPCANTAAHSTALPAPCARARIRPRQTRHAHLAIWPPQDRARVSPPPCPARVERRGNPMAYPPNY